VNLGITLGAHFLRFVYRFYWNLALRYPPLINAFYRGADNPFLVKIIDRLMGITILPRFVQYLEREKPDLVLSTYFTFTHYLELLQRVGQLDAVSVVLNPEPFDSHQIWFSPTFDWSLVFSPKSAREVVEKGISKAKVKLFSFPIKPSYATRRESKVVLRRKLALGQRPFTVLFFFGAEGGVGLDVEVRGGGALVFAIGEFPENAGDGVGIIAERERAGGHTAGATLAVRVVEGGRAYAHYDIGLAALDGGVGEQAAVGADEDDDVLVIYGVADEIRSGI